MQQLYIIGGDIKSVDREFAGMHRVRKNEKVSECGRGLLPDPFKTVPITGGSWIG